MNDARSPSNGVFERLHGDGRTQPIPERVLDAVTPEAIDEARRLVSHAIREGWTTEADLSQRTAHGADVVSDFCFNRWGDRLAGLHASVASDLARAVNQIIREREAEETKVGGFVTIRVAEAILGIVRYAMKRRQLAVFLVQAGLGKTITLDTFAIETPGSLLLTVTRSRSTVKPFLQLLARHLELNETGRVEDIQDRVVESLRASQRLLLIDEAHKLSVPALDALRELWDATRIPIVLAATPSFYQTITARRIGTHTSELMDQFYSRVGIFRDLTAIESPRTGDPEPPVTVEDIRKVYARGHVRLARDGADFLCKLANTPGAGGLRTCTDLVQLVVDLFPGDVVNARLLHEALRTRLGIKEAGLRMETVEDAHGQVAATA